MTAEPVARLGDRGRRRSAGPHQGERCGRDFQHRRACRERSAGVPRAARHSGVVEYDRAPETGCDHRSPGERQELAFAINRRATIGPAGEARERGARQREAGRLAADRETAARRSGERFLSSYSSLGQRRRGEDRPSPGRRCRGRAPSRSIVVAGDGEVPLAWSAIVVPYWAVRPSGWSSSVDRARCSRTAPRRGGTAKTSAGGRVVDPRDRRAEVGIEGDRWSGRPRRRA